MLQLTLLASVDLPSLPSVPEVPGSPFTVSSVDPCLDNVVIRKANLIEYMFCTPYVSLYICMIFNADCRLSFVMLLNDYVTSNSIKLQFKNNALKFHSITLYNIILALTFSFFSPFCPTKSAKCLFNAVSFNKLSSH